MPKVQDLRRVMVIGSGPIVIGQAAEFDYAGTQACQSLKEEGLEVVLINSNPATIMTDAGMADRVYLEPLTMPFLEKVIEREKPDGLLPTLGGQVGLNLACQLAEAGALERHGVRLLGTPLEAIQKAEDREMFKKTMLAIGQPVPESVIVHDVTAAQAFAADTGFPVIVRPAYTLGGSGGGIAAGPAELDEVAVRGLKQSPIGQILVEKSVAGYKEIEYEVLRDSRGNCITVCNMENFDPVGIHTGDSIVVAPSQTLADKEYQMLRTASLKIIEALGIEGGCNVQYALDTRSQKYYVIEVNPRVSRSSALASKATGYPIAKIAARIAIGLTLDEIKNPVTGTTYAGFEPALDYVVLKIPRWPFDKFATAHRTLGTQMKATGEVMAIDRTFEASLLKAVRSLELGKRGLVHPGVAAIDDAELILRLHRADDERLFLLAEALRRGASVDELSRITGIDPFFLAGIERIVSVEDELREAATAGRGFAGPTTSAKAESTAAASKGAPLPRDLLLRAKRLGMADSQIAALVGTTEGAVRERRRELGILPVYKMVDTCAAEFEAATPYYYSTYEGEDEVTASARRKVVVLGSGPIRIGQGIEFDYCSVHAVRALREEGVESIIINCNPETVSTDFNTSDRLYFEPLVTEDVLNVMDKERPEGVIVQFGGQTAINLAGPLHCAGVAVLGTPVEEVDRAEDRDKFDRLLTELDIPRPAGGTATSTEGALAVAHRVGFPVVVRPSYVLGGRAMEICYSPAEIERYMSEAVIVSESRPILIDRYLPGREVEVDAIADGEEVLIPGIMEHIERAGVHSGDSVAVYPTQRLSDQAKTAIVDYTTRLARALKVRGLINIQYVVYEGKVYVLEVNPRSSRTVPFLTKMTGIPMVGLATRIILGHNLADLGYRGGLWPDRPYVGVKAPVFSWGKLTRVDTSLGPEMKSTGEVMGIDSAYGTALYKAFVAAGIDPAGSGPVLITVSDRDKEEVLPIAVWLSRLGHPIYATRGTAAALGKAGIKARAVAKIGEGSSEIVDLIRAGKISLVINTLTRGKIPERDGYRIRRAAAEHGIPCLTSLDTAAAMARALTEVLAGRDVQVVPLQQYQAMAGPPWRRD